MADADAGEQQRPAHQFNWRPVRLVVLVIVIVLVVAAVLYFFWLQNTPSESELKDQAGLTGKSELLIGVKDDIPSIGYRDPATGQYSGFDIDIAYMIAADLGFQSHEVRFLTIEDEDRNRGNARDGDHHVTVDLVIAHYSVTPKREEEATVSFSNPYLATEQSVITRLGHPEVQHLRDLRGNKVCTVSTSTSEKPAVEEGVDIIPRSNHDECIRGLRNGEFDAVTSDAAILAGFVAAEREVFAHHDIGLEVQESWGVNTVGNEALRTLVNLTLYRSRNDPEDRRWEDAYNKHLRPLARASLPQPVAIDEQPDVKEVDIRQWPWERVVGMARPPLYPSERRRRAAFSGR